MSELTFTYRGKDLVPPLSATVASLAAEIGAVEAALSKAEERDPLPRANELATPDTPARKLKRELDALLYLHLDAELWLQECKRTPRTKWILNIPQLRAVYRPMVDPRIVEKRA